MKPLKQVESDRRSYHKNENVNTVHRSSLIVPEIEGATAEISFLNHFLLKRRYPNVGCRITAIDLQGNKIESKLFPITEPRVYRFKLTGMTETPCASYLVDFYSAENLFIPFPAVMVNHYGPDFFNNVHSYNRVLNDVFENDAINSVQQSEAAIDVASEKGIETVVFFTAGQTPIEGELLFELITETATHTASVTIQTKRFCTKKVLLKDIFPSIRAGTTGTLKIRQPKQFMFYGRMLVGQCDEHGSFIGNHSYYDSSNVQEYWDDDRPSARIYPYFQSFKHGIRIYPIMSPSSLDFTLGFQDRSGKLISEYPLGKLQSPSAKFFDIDVEQIAQRAGVETEKVTALCLSARGERVPTRVNHQLIVGRGKLAASINLSLMNPNSFTPEGKTALIWGQGTIGSDLNSWLGIIGGGPAGTSEDITIVFYDQRGKLTEVKKEIFGGGSVTIDFKREFSHLVEITPATPEYIWYYITSIHPTLLGVTVTENSKSEHCTGEHNF